MRSCDEILELISAALDGELTERERQELEAHLDACPACSVLFQELSGLRDASADLEEAPAGFAGQVMAQIAAEPAQEQPESVIPFPAKKRCRIPWKGWAASAAVVAVVLLGALALPGQLGADNNGSIRSTSGGSVPAGTADAAYDAEIAPESEAVDEMGDMDAVCAPDLHAEEWSAYGGAEAASKQDGAPAPAPTPEWPPVEGNRSDISAQDEAPAALPASDDILMGTAAPTPAIFCGVLIMTGEPLPEGLEEFEAEVEEDGAVSYVVPASYFFSNSSNLKIANASNYIDYSLESNADPTAEFGLIIVEPPAE